MSVYMTLECLYFDCVQSFTQIDNVVGHVLKEGLTRPQLIAKCVALDLQFRYPFQRCTVVTGLMLRV
jgi:hypothetical protein